MGRKTHQKAVNEKKCPECGDEVEVRTRSEGVGTLA